MGKGRREEEEEEEEGEEDGWKGERGEVMTCGPACYLPRATRELERLESAFTQLW